MAENPPAADRPGTSGAAGDDGATANDPATSDPATSGRAANGPAADGPAANGPAANDPAASAAPANDRATSQDGDRATDEPASDAPDSDRAEGNGDSTDDVFLAMVARFDDEPSDRSWPAAENIGGPRRSPAVTDRPDSNTLQHGPRDGGMVTEDLVDGAAGPGTRRGEEELQDLPDLEDTDAFGAGEDYGDYEDDNEDDEHFEPPPAPPAPRMKPVTRMALGSIALGLAILLVPTFVGYRGSSTQDLTGVLLILGGVGTLVAKMGDRPPTDSDGPDDGAVV
jgi:hypothetical protein